MRFGGGLSKGAAETRRATKCRVRGNDETGGGGRRRAFERIGGRGVGRDGTVFLARIVEMSRPGRRSRGEGETVRRVAFDVRREFFRDRRQRWGGDRVAIGQMYPAERTVSWFNYSNWFDSQIHKQIATFLMQYVVVANANATSKTYLRCPTQFREIGQKK